MSVLVDTSIWIDYFRTGNNSERLDFLIDENLILNGIGIPDLIVAQNAKQNHCEIYSLDSHFKLMKDILRLQLTG
jgi:predicted nucleic acid-binding protein